MKEYREKYEKWCRDPFIDEETKKELLSLTDEKDIEDRFYKDLEFGTAGLRGIMGAGTNRMNRYTVGRATFGLAMYLLEAFADAKTRGVAVGYDTRNNSHALAEVASAVLSACGIKVYLFNMPSPTPSLSFAVRELGCVSGIVITASHNPPAYNGYKVYDEKGCQLGIEASEIVIQKVNSVTDFSSVPANGDKKLITAIGMDIIEKYTNAVLVQSTFSDAAAKRALKIVYTPIHGTGNVPVRMILEKDGFTNVTVVPEQEYPDGNFPTVKSPNPEERGALELGIALMEKTDADIVIGTDPDADRIGCAVNTKDGTKLITGNQMGALLVDFILKTKTVLGENPVIVKTIVTSELGAEIAKKNGCGVMQVLTGFKFIGNVIAEFEKEAERGSSLRHHFVMGFEESYGYLAGTHARDKDSVVAAMLICEMAAYHAKNKKTLFDALENLYSEYGYYLDTQTPFTLSGKDGIERISEIMKVLRTEGKFIPGTKEVIDYSLGIDSLPKSNVLKFVLDGGSWIVVRPSGTEPKIKVYYSIRDNNRETALSRFESLRRTVEEKMGLN